MASRSLGSLTLDLIANIGGYTRGLGAAEKEAAKRAKAIEKAFDGAVNVVTTSLAVIGTTGVAAFAALNRQIEGIADFKQISEQIGDTAAAVASLKPASDVSGVAIDSVAAASVKLTAALSKTDDESKAVGQAVGALGLNFAEFKKLSPVEQLNSVAQAMGKFADGSEKTAVAVALFGRSGAELIPFLNDLAQETGSQIKLTEQQIAAADEYTKSQARLRSELQQFIQFQAAEAVPTLTAVQDVIATITKNQAALEVVTTIVSAAMNVAITIFQTLAVVGSDVGFVFLSVGREIGAWAAQIAALGRGDLQGFRAISDAVKEDAQRARAELDKFQAQVLNIGKGGAVAGLAAQAGINSIGVASPRLDVSGLSKPASTGGKSKDVNDAEQYLKRLQDQYTATLDLTVAEKALIDIRAAGFKGLTPELEKQILLQATIIDAEKQAAERFKERQDALDEAVDAQRALSEQGIAIFQATRTPLENLNAELRRLNDLQRAGVIDWDTYKRAVEQAQDAFTELGNKGKKELSELDEFTLQAARNIQDALGDGLVKIMEGNFKDIGKNFEAMLRQMVAQALAADIANKLFGKDLKGGGLLSQLGNLLKSSGGTAGNNPSAYTAGGEGFFGTALKFFSGFFAEGGTIPAGHFGVVGERGMELVSGPATVTPMNKVGGSSVINLTVNVPETTSRTSAAQIAARTGAAVNRALAMKR